MLISGLATTLSCASAISASICCTSDHDDVTVEAIVKVLLENADKARALVKNVAPRVQGDAAACQCGCRSVLQYAIITAPEARDPAMVEKLSAVAGRVLEKRGVESGK